MTDDAGEDFLLDLPRATRLADGDGLELDDGGVVRVNAAAEAMIEVDAETPEQLLRIAWHIGNRHTPLQVLSDGRLRILADPVLEAMITGLGGRLRPVECPFFPEFGAYTHGAAQPLDDGS